MESSRNVSVRTFRRPRLPGTTDWPKPRRIPLLVVLIAGMSWLAGCGSDGNPAVSAPAARVHMEDHLANDLSADPHTGSDGSSVAERVRRASPQTTWLAVGENVALSSGTALHQLTDLWLTAWHASPVHCSNQLNPIFNRAGVSVGVKAGQYATVVVFGQKAGG